jgi:regulatory Fis family protein
MPAKKPRAKTGRADPLKPQVNPNTVRNVCIEFIKALVNLPTLPREQFLPALGTLNDGTLLAMFCVLRLWAVDAWVRLCGVGPIRDWKSKFEQLESQLAKLSETDLLTLSAQSDDGISILFLATAMDALGIVAVEINERLQESPIGESYVQFRDSENRPNLEKILHQVSPPKSYYRIPGEPHEDRRNDILVGFFAFIDKLKKKNTPVGDWENFPHTVLESHRPAPHPQLDKEARNCLNRDIGESLSSELPILSGKLETASLQMRTVLRDKYKQWCPDFTFPATGETVTPRHLDLEKIGSDKMRELGDLLAAESVLHEGAKERAKERKLLQIAKQDSALYFAWMKHQGNKSKIAAELGMSRPTLDSRLKKILKKIRSKTKRLRD